MKSKFLITALLGVFVFCGINTGNKNTVRSASLILQQDMGMMDIMHKTMTQMDTFKLTGDPDYDFAMLTSIHHTGGSLLLNQEIKNGSNGATKRLAKKIKDEQDKDWKSLQDFVLNYTVSQHNSSYLKDMKSVMQKAKQDMNSNMNMSGNMDKDFATIMSMHHQHGIAIAHMELQYGTNPEMKALAQRMINNQQKEIDQLDNLKQK